MGLQLEERSHLVYNSKILQHYFTEFLFEDTACGFPSGTWGATGGAAAADPDGFDSYSSKTDILGTVGVDRKTVLVHVYNC